MVDMHSNDASLDKINLKVGLRSDTWDQSVVVDQTAERKPFLVEPIASRSRCREETRHVQHIDLVDPQSSRRFR